jgi:hypothetical protein
MVHCVHCDVPMHEASRFCSSCGTANLNQPADPRRSRQAYEYSPLKSGHHPASKGFGQVYGLDPRIAFLAFIIDSMLFGSAVPGFTLPVVIPVAVVAGAILGSITFKAQLKWYGDDRESAMIKAGIVGLLTAIPVGIPVFAWIASGTIGLLHNFKKKLALES